MRPKYPARGAVSIWIGSFDSESQMDECTDDSIEPSLRLPAPLSSICEIAFEPENVPVRQLLEGFSGWESFADKACEVAALNNIDQANGALVCYYLLCDAPVNYWPNIKYLGSFHGQDVS